MGRRDFPAIDGHQGNLSIETIDAVVSAAGFESLGQSWLVRFYPRSLIGRQGLNGERIRASGFVSLIPCGFGCSSSGLDRTFSIPDRLTQFESLVAKDSGLKQPNNDGGNNSDTRPPIRWGLLILFPLIFCGFLSYLIGLEHDHTRWGRCAFAMGIVSMAVGWMGVLSFVIWPRVWGL